MRHFINIVFTSLMSLFAVSGVAAAHEDGCYKALNLTCSTASVTGTSFIRVELSSTNCKTTTSMTTTGMLANGTDTKSTGQLRGNLFDIDTLGIAYLVGNNGVLTAWHSQGFYYLDAFGARLNCKRQNLAW